MTVSAHVLDRFQVPNVITHDTTILSRQAYFAMELVARWGVVAAVPDGEDSVGRQQLRVMTPVELTDRAIKITELMFERMAEKEFTQEAQDWETLLATFREGQEKD